MEKAMNDFFGSRLESVVSASSGDLRMALHLGSLMKLCLKSVDFDPQKYSLSPQFSLFHRIGKIIYPRKNESLPNFGELLEDNPDTFNLYLHQNCYQHVSDLQSLVRISSSFSDCEYILGNNYVRFFTSLIMQNIVIGKFSGLYCIS